MKVLESRVLVQVEKACTQKIGEIEVPVGIGEYEVAKVIAVGPKSEGVAVGDTVFIYPGCGKNFMHEGQSYRAVTINEIIVVL